MSVAPDEELKRLGLSFQADRLRLVEKQKSLFDCDLTQALDLRLPSGFLVFGIVLGFASPALYIAGFIFLIYFGIGYFEVLRLKREEKKAMIVFKIHGIDAWSINGQIRDLSVSDC